MNPRWWITAAVPALLIWAALAWSLQTGAVRTTRSKVSRSISDKAHLITCGPASKGTGFFVDQRHFFTAYHVIQNCDPKNILVAQNLNVNAINWTDRDRDAALLTVEPSGYNPPIVEISCELPGPGDRVIITGFPLSAKERVKTVDGKVMIPYWFGLPDAASDGRPLLQNNAIVEGEVFPGMSGGPVFDRNTGQVLGWVSYTATPLPGHKYAGVGLFYDACAEVQTLNQTALKDRP